MSIKQLNVRINETLIKDFKYFALENDTNINTLVERALEFYLLCQTNIKDELYTPQLISFVNDELQYFLLNDSMKIELSEGVAPKKISALYDYKKL